MSEQVPSNPHSDNARFTPGRVVPTAAAWLLAGVALWFTLGSLDLSGDAQRTTRIAVLPSGPELLGLVVLVLAIASGVRAGIRRTHPRHDNVVRQMSLPLFGLVVLSLPYLPWLPDRVRLLRSFAGPAAFMVWMVVLGQVGLTAMWMRPPSRSMPRPHPSSREALAIFLATFVVSAAVAITLRNSGVYPGGPGGDEPRYLMMMQSGMVWLMVLLTGVTAALTWRWAAVSAGSREAATFAWAAIFTGAPVLFNSVTVYPDIAAALCVMLALAWEPQANGDVPGWPMFVMRGAAVGLLPWLSTTYAPMALALAAVLVFRALHHRRMLVALLAPLALSFCGWAAFSYRSWSAPSPTASYFSQLSVARILTGTFGLLFDQESGVIAFAPALAIGLIAMASMIVSSRDHQSRRRGLEVALVFFALLGPVAAFELWWGGSAPPGRPLVSGLPLLALPIAWQYRRSATSPVQRAAYQLLLLIGIAVSLAMILAQDGLLIPQDRDGSSNLLQWLSPLWPVWGVMPSFGRFPDAAPLPNEWLLTALWIAVALVAGWFCRKSLAIAPGSAALTAAGYFFIALLGLSFAAPAMMRGDMPPDPNPAARPRVPLLDAFDAQARPIGLIYNPFTVTDARNIPPLMILSAEPGLRTARQPVHVFLKARFALPAGEYEVQISKLPEGQTERSGTVGLQVGRAGSPLREWQADLGSHESWQTTFMLPVDAEFVGFITSPALESAQSLRLRPLRIVDAGKRPSGPTVLSAATFGPTSVFFHDAEVYAEQNGFWLRGKATTTITIAPDEAQPGITLRLRSGPRPIRVTLETATWKKPVDLTPNAWGEVQVPRPVRSEPLLLRMTASDGFVPADVLPSSTDRRMLACWVEFPR